MKLTTNIWSNNFILQVRDRDLDIAKLHTQVENNRCHPSTRDPEIMKDDYTIANLRATIVSLEDSNSNLRNQLQGWHFFLKAFLFMCI